MRFSLGSGFLYINKHKCKHICPVWLQGRKDCFSCYSLSLPANNLFCRPWFRLVTSSGRHLPLFLLRLFNYAVVSRCCCFSARGNLISCPPSLLPPRLLVSPVVLVVFPMSVFLSVGAGFTICCLDVSCRVGSRFTDLASHVLMKALVRQEFTLIHSFTRLWLRIISYVLLLVGWGRLHNMLS